MSLGPLNSKAKHAKSGNAPYPGRHSQCILMREQNCYQDLQPVQTLTPLVLMRLSGWRTGTWLP